jgi:uncharacterized Zn-finger protein
MDVITYMEYSIKTEDVEVEPGLILNNKDNVEKLVKLVMPENLEILTANSPHNAIHFQDFTIKKEQFEHKNLVCDDTTTHDDAKHSMECLKHEYKYEEDSTHCITHNVEAGNSVFVKSELPYDSMMSTEKHPYNKADFQESIIKMGSMAHPNPVCDGHITPGDGKHSPACNCMCLKREYKDAEDDTLVMTNVDAGAGCTPAISKRYTCVTCTKSFHSKGGLNMHIRVHTGDKLYMCDMCMKSFSRKSHLVLHVRVHTGDKPYKCYTCRKSFSDKSNLAKHLQIHTDDKPYKCDTCRKLFSTNGNLVRHMKIHTDDRPYTCDTCGKRYITKGELISHVRVHTGDKPYSCDTCAKSFHSKGLLMIHANVHSGENPYKCDTCLKLFTRKHDLMRHIKTHTGDKPYKCDTWGTSFSHKGSLVKHTKFHADDTSAAYVFITS